MYKAIETSIVRVGVTVTSYDKIILAYSSPSYLWITHKLRKQAILKKHWWPINPSVRIGWKVRVFGDIRAVPALSVETTFQQRNLAIKPLN